MLSTYYGITYDDYSNLYKFVIACSVLIVAPLFYLIFIRDYLRIGIISRIFHFITSFDNVR